MMVAGKWLDNTTCRKCKQRHPPSISCLLAKSIADEQAAERDEMTDQEFIESVPGPVAVLEATVEDLRRQTLELAITAGYNKLMWAKFSAALQQINVLAERDAYVPSVFILDAQEGLIWP